MRASFYRRLPGRVAALAATLLFGVLPAGAADEPQAVVADYDLKVDISPARNLLDVQAVIELAEVYAGQPVEFLLTDAVEVLQSNPPLERLPFEEGQGFSGINGSSVDLTEEGHEARYRAVLPPGSTRLELTYRGKVNFPLGGQAEQYTRGFQSTAGIVAKQGVYLAGSSLWYPYFSNELVSFKLSTNVPKNWHLISQGNGSSRTDKGRADWDSAGPVDEIYLVGGPLVKYAEPAGAVAAEVYLREEDAALAQRYLTATAQYLEMYRNLIGPYPYGKFALVENFWETGYGMPSFTLLGPQIIRFPFILTSSYPHEILHNWWGNSVFVDYQTGNWCEGLTAYMADHLMQEQRGGEASAVYRRDTLKKYRDFVSEGRDFPITEFRSRHSAATEAVGYGKVLMGFHMLRRQIGDEAFRAAMARFYRTNRGRQASFADVQAALEASAEVDLDTFFSQWIDRVGAPDLRVTGAEVSGSEGAYRITGQLQQAQGGEAYELQVPVYVTTAAGLETFTVASNAAVVNFELQTQAKPLLLEVDSEFDLFRLLDPRETAPSIGQIFGEQDILAVLPSAASAETQAAYRELAESWQSDAHGIDIRLDTELEELPADKAAWFFGADNLWVQRLFGGEDSQELELRDDQFVAAGQAIPYAGHSAVIVRRHPGNQSKAIGLINVNPPEAFAGVSSKLPHYGKYSYLGFEGAEPTNTVKGEWAATDSPLRVDLRSPSARGTALVAAAPPARAALAELPAVFSRDALLSHVNVLAGKDMAGRGLGTPGLERAADYIEAEFRAAGLQPGAADGKWSQKFRVEEGEDGKPHEVRNIIGILPGSNSDMAGEAVIVAAHYDHLGGGWPDSRAAAGDGVYFGADDNASGVAVLLELAATLAGEAAPERSIVFIAFTGEEAGKLGSKYFVANPAPYGLDGIIGVINMDTVGRLEGKDLSVFGAGSASEWQHVFRGIGFTTGIQSTMITTELDSSDQQSFIDAGIPGVQLSSGATYDYHRPTDTADKVDGDGLVKVAVVAKEAVAYLASRPEKLTVTIAAASDDDAAKKPAQPGSRKASVGTVPDFAYSGNGVRVGSVVPGSPAAAAGIREGDILVRLADKPVSNLQEYSDVLKTLEPGQVVGLLIQRAGAEQDVSVTLTDR